jgi:hypothetical protein
MRRFSLISCAIIASLGIPPATAATLYEESYQGEQTFPLHPEVDLLNIGGMFAGSEGGGTSFPALPVCDGMSCVAEVVSSGAVYPPNEVTGTGIPSARLLVLGQPFTATAQFGPLHVVPTTSTANGFVTMLLHNTTTRYFISASVFIYRIGPGVYPSLNIAEFVPGLPVTSRSVSLIGIAVDTQNFAVDLVVDPANDVALARLTVGGLTFQTAPLPLQAHAIAVQQPDQLSQLLGTENQFGPGNAAAVELRGFRLAAAAVQPSIDVRPGDPRNFIVRDSRVPVPVTIFSDAVFDATTVLPETVTLAGAPVARSWRGDYLCVRIDMNRDQRPDLTCDVAPEKIDAPVGESTVTLLAKDNTGIPVIGQDHIRVIH